MKKRTKFLSMILAVLMLLSVVPLTASAEVIASGTSDNITWTFDDEGTLTISGTGEMTDTSWSKHKYSIKNVVIEEGVTSIKHGAFEGYSDLATLSLPDSLITIGNSAFSGCYSLAKINIPENVTSIGNSAFAGVGASKIFIPASVTTIGNGAFGGLYLDSITVSKNNPSYSSENGVLFNKDKTTLISCPGYWYQAKTYSIPQGVTTIESYAFSSSEVEEIIIPDSVTTIKYNALRIYSDIIYTGTYEQWEEIETNYSKDEIHFEYYDAVTTVGSGKCGENLTWTLDNKGTLAISGTGEMYNDIDWGSDPYIRKVVINDGVTSIGHCAFYECKNLIEVQIPDSVTYIGDRAFMFCESLADIKLPDNITAINRGTFEYCYTLDNVIIPEGVTTISEDAFFLCESLSDLTLPESLTTIEIYAFADCLNLYEITIPRGVAALDNYSLGWCSSLREVTLYDTISSIEKSAFINCYNLTDVYYEGTAEQWNYITIGDSNDYLTNATIHYHYNNHNYEAVLTTPTCTTQGYTTYICDCGDSFIENYVDTDADAHINNDGDNYCDNCGKYINNCGCNCHKTGFIGFFWKIINFFNKIFGLNKICECGMAHY